MMEKEKNRTHKDYKLKWNMKMKTNRIKHMMTLDEGVRNKI